jgi:hypothetical protein
MVELPHTRRHENVQRRVHYLCRLVLKITLKETAYSRDCHLLIVANRVNETCVLLKQHYRVAKSFLFCGFVYEIVLAFKNSFVLYRIAEILNHRRF